MTITAPHCGEFVEVAIEKMGIQAFPKHAPTWRSAAVFHSPQEAVTEKLGRWLCFCENKTLRIKTSKVRFFQFQFQFLVQF